MSEFSVKELRARLAAASIDTSACVEKADLLKLFEQHIAAVATTPGVSEEAAPAAAPSPSTAAAATAMSEWEELSTLKLKKLLLSHGISTDGCAERADFLEVAERHRSKLQGEAPEAVDISAQDAGISTVDKLRRPSAAPPKGAIVDSPEAQKQLAAERREREALKAAKGGGYKPDAGRSGDHQALAAMRQSKNFDEREAAKPQPCLGDVAVQMALRERGGYQVDMFGVKRGACTKDSSCYRFAPPPPTAGRVLAQATCERCGRGSSDHEDFGVKAAGEPDLVDEQGRCYTIHLTGGGGVHDSAALRYDLMKEYTWGKPKQQEHVVGRGGAFASSERPDEHKEADEAAAKAAEQAARLRRELKAARDVD